MQNTGMNRNVRFFVNLKMCFISCPPREDGQEQQARAHQQVDAGGRRERLHEGHRRQAEELVQGVKFCSIHDLVVSLFMI